MVFFRRSDTQQFFSSSRAWAPEYCSAHPRPRQRDVHQNYHPMARAGARGAALEHRVTRRTIGMLGLFILASAHAYVLAGYFVRLSRTVCFANCPDDAMCFLGNQPMV